MNEQTNTSVANVLASFFYIYTRLSYISMCKTVAEEDKYEKWNNSQWNSIFEKKKLPCSLNAIVNELDFLCVRAWRCGHCL